MKLTKPEIIIVKIALRYYRDEATHGEPEGYSEYAGLKQSSTQYLAITSVLRKLEK